MNSKTMSGKTIGKTISKVASAVFTVGALALTMAGANAQGVYTSYGNLSVGATPISLSPFAPYTLNPFNTGAQDYSAFGGMNGNAYGGAGYTNFSGIGGYGGLGGPGFYDVGGGFSTAPPSSGLTFLDGNYGGGYTTLGPNGMWRVNPDPGYSAYLAAYNQYLYDQAKQAANSRSANNANNSLPIPLSQAITLQRGSNFDVTVGWHGSPDTISRMTVTLLNRYHLPVAQQVADGASPAYFAANASTFAARYYRVEVQYTDGATATVILPLRSSDR